MSALRHLPLPLVFIAATAAAITGCISATSSGDSVAGGGIGGTGISSGPIDGFGSIFVNGIEFDIDSALIVVDGVDATEATLRIGMVVQVCGSWNEDGTGTAVSVTYGSELEGPVTANDVGPDHTGTLSILGQTVIVDASTRVEGVASADLIPVGARVEISGYSAGDGTLYATRIQMEESDGDEGDENGEIEVSGTVSDLNESELTFSIGGLVVYYGNVGSLPPGFDDGLYVEVESESGLDDEGRLIADEIEAEDDIDTSCSGVGDDARIQGRVTTALSGDFFAIDGDPAQITADTEFENGSRADLEVGALVEVEGYFSGGVLVVEHIDFED